MTVAVGEQQEQESDAVQVKQTFTCFHPGCKYAAKRRGDLKRHLADIHNEGVVWYSCSREDCEYATKRKGNLKRHMFLMHCVEEKDGALPAEKWAKALPCGMGNTDGNVERSGEVSHPPLSGSRGLMSENAPSVNQCRGLEAKSSSISRDDHDIKNYNRTNTNSTDAKANGFRSAGRRQHYPSHWMVDNNMNRRFPTWTRNHSFPPDENHGEMYHPCFSQPPQRYRAPQGPRALMPHADDEQDLHDPVGRGAWRHSMQLGALPLDGGFCGRREAADWYEAASRRERMLELMMLEERMLEHEDRCTDMSYRVNRSLTSSTFGKTEQGGFVALHERGGDARLHRPHMTEPLSIFSERDHRNAPAMSPRSWAYSKQRKLTAHGLENHNLQMDRKRDRGFGPGEMRYQVDINDRVENVFKMVAKAIARHKTGSDEGSSLSSDATTVLMGSK